MKDRATLKSTMEEAGLIADDMRNHGVLISTDGPLDIVLKIKSPMTLGFHEAGILSDALNTALSRS